MSRSMQEDICGWYLEDRHRRRTLPEKRNWASTPSNGPKHPRTLSRKAKRRWDGKGGVEIVRYNSLRPGNCHALVIRLSGDGNFLDWI